MLTVVTKCPQCITEQVADIRNRGKMLLCAKCGSMFKCKIESGPYLWAQPAVATIVEGGFKKLVTHVVLTYGVAVPIANQDAFIAHLGRSVDFKDPVPAKIKIEGTVYDMQMLLFKKKNGEPALHLKWGKNSKILSLLKKMFKEAHEHYCVEKKRDCLPGNDFMVYPDTQEGVFVLTALRDGIEKMPPPRVTRSPKVQRACPSLTISSLLKETD